MLTRGHKEDQNTVLKDQKIKINEKEEQKEEYYSDPKFESILVTRFVNNLMLDGKKNTAFKVLYGA